MEILHTIARENVTMYAILAIIIYNSKKYVRISYPRPIQNQILTTINADIKDLKRDMLTLKNDMNRIQNETEWRSEVRSQGQASVLSYRTEYSSETETLWEIGLSSTTLATFYRHQKSLQRTSLDNLSQRSDSHSIINETRNNKAFSITKENS
ncbi:hypothetical protein Glove_216g167 [Diversispora epigaea]|uniref:Uncharacterized protein n=1 Tax=Diversispora epigaea TaxID=1348612 RepID=A0A397IQ61_9GLOM|nr:hypothetical protein Glove_216g167 [Diversispora epigaea]